ncbi:FIC family protein [Mycoavidus cysteinexigens]|uniref:FIC family protein n=1 Tax=Mycoavidus cysteinexigens TaxID=1553431 RepID=A0A2Z6EVC5_9BURK|nr:hypothetical protein [Mycoavidus cysteinexigens]BBE09420.1 FIC family protein [Mycoavidus cysteinexigens]GAM51823.1 fic family protein [bacterium endosymbiont of Mortierella elongata FMR23-6]GLR01639.1 hypothetical protein GCM10007934_14510 [Mycoavidus cysteinexigens]
MNAEVAPVNRMFLSIYRHEIAFSFEEVVLQMTDSQNKEDKDHAILMRTLDPKQRRTLELFQSYTVVTSAQIGELFGFKSRTNTTLCKKWVEARFLEIVDHSNKARKYKLAKPFDALVADPLV